MPAVLPVPPDPLPRTPRKAAVSAAVPVMMAGRGAAAARRRPGAAAGLAAAAVQRAARTKIVVKTLPVVILDAVIDTDQKTVWPVEQNMVVDELHHQSAHLPVKLHLSAVEKLLAALEIPLQPMSLPEGAWSWLVVRPF